MENTKELLKILREIGCKANFKPYQETESRAVCLAVRRPAKIEDGRLKGSEIDLCGPSTFRVWTPRAKKAKACAARYGLRIRLMDGECELFIPAHLADDLLPKFGAKVKRILTDAQLDRLRAHSFKNKQAFPAQEGHYGPISPQKGI